MQSLQRSPGESGSRTTGTSDAIPMVRMNSTGTVAHTAMTNGATGATSQRPPIAARPAAAPRPSAAAMQALPPPRSSTGMTPRPGTIVIQTASEVVRPAIPNPTPPTTAPATIRIVLPGAGVSMPRLPLSSGAPQEGSATPGTIYIALPTAQASPPTCPAPFVSHGTHSPGALVGIRTSDFWTGTEIANENQRIAEFNRRQLQYYHDYNQYRERMKALAQSDPTVKVPHPIPEPTPLQPIKTYTISPLPVRVVSRGMGPMGGHFGNGQVIGGVQYYHSGF